MAAAGEAASAISGFRLELAVYAVLFFLVALVFSTELQVQFTLPKLLVIRAMAPLLGVLWVWRLRRNQVQPLPWYVVASAIALSAWWIVTTIFAVDPVTAAEGADGRYNGLWSGLLFLLIFLLVASSRFETTEIERLIKYLLAALIPVSVYALAQYAGMDPIRWPGARSASTIGNPVILAATLALGLPFALVFMLLARRSGGRVVWGAVLSILLAAMVTTLSRGPLVAGVAGLFVVLAAIAWEHRQWLNKTALVIAVVALVPVLFVGYRQVIQLRESITSSRPDETTRTLRDRLNTYTAALQVIRDHPITGVGLENFVVVYPRYRSAASEQLTPDVMPTMVHSGYLQAAATTGIPGLVAYLALVFSVLFALGRAYASQTDKRTRWLILAFIASITVFLIQDVSGWQEISLSMFFWMILALGLSASRSRDAVAVPAWLRPAAYAAVGACAAGAVWLTAETIALVRADLLMRHAQQMPVTDAWPQVEADLTKALTHTSSAGYLAKAGVRYAERFAATGDAAAYRTSKDLLREAQRRDPFNPYFVIPEVALNATARQRKIAHDMPESERQIARALQMDPNNASVYEAVARVRLAENRTSEALELVEKARELRPAQGRFLVLEGDIRRSATDRTGAAAAYGKATALINSNDNEWLNTYHKLVLTLIEAGLHQRAVDSARQLAKLKPTDGMAHTLLGFALLQTGDLTSAKQALTLALTINPNDSNAKQGLAEVDARLRQ